MFIIGGCDFEFDYNQPGEEMDYRIFHEIEEESENYSGDEKLEDSLIVRTDRNNYYIDDSIRIEVFNCFNSNIYFSSTALGIEIEKRNESGAWCTYDVVIVGQDRRIKLPPRKIISISLSDYILDETGEYRLNVNGNLGKEIDSVSVSGSTEINIVSSRAE